MRKKLSGYIMKIFLTIFILGAVISGPVFAAELASGQPVTAAFADVQDDFWAKPAIDSWSSKGIIKGDGINFYPYGRITRAEMVVILGNIFGYGEKTENPFSDVKKEDWYYDALIKAYAQGILQGSLDASGNRMARPNEPLTRAEAAVIFKEIFSIAGNSGSNSSFKDSLPAWSKEAVYGMEAAGYVHGKESGLFDPSGNLTRAEAVQMLENVVKLYICQPGDYSVNVSGNVVVNTPDAVLKSMKITGNLYLAEGIGEGAVSLENVTVTGSTFVRGGGVDKITIKDSVLGTKVIEKQGIDLDKSPRENQPAPTSSGNTGNPGSSGGSGGSGSTGGTGDSGNPGGSDDSGDSGDPGSSDQIPDNGDIVDF